MPHRAPLTRTWYSAMPVSSADASQLSDTFEEPTSATWRLLGAVGGPLSRSVVTVSRLLVALLPLGSTAWTEKKYCTLGRSPVQVYEVWDCGSVAVVGSCHSWTTYFTLPELSVERVQASATLVLPFSASLRVG